MREINRSFTIYSTVQSNSAQVNQQKYIYAQNQIKYDVTGQTVLRQLQVL